MQLLITLFSVCIGVHECFSLYIFDGGLCVCVCLMVCLSVYLTCGYIINFRQQFFPVIYQKLKIKYLHGAWTKCSACAAFGVRESLVLQASEPLLCVASLHVLQLGARQWIHLAYCSSRLSFVLLIQNSWLGGNNGRSSCSSLFSFYCENKIFFFILYSYYIFISLFSGVGRYNYEKTFFPHMSLRKYKITCSCIFGKSLFKPLMRTASPLQRRLMHFIRGKLRRHQRVSHHPDPRRQTVSLGPRASQNKRDFD